MTFHWWLFGAGVIVFLVVGIGTRLGRNLSPERKRLHTRRVKIVAGLVFVLAISLFPLPYVSSSGDYMLSAPSEISGENSVEQIKALTREVESLRSEIYGLRNHLSALATLCFVVVFTFGIQYLLTPVEVNRDDIEKKPLGLDDEP